MSHDEFTGLAAGYALSALDADDLKLFEAHLASCPECRASVAGLRPLVDCLSMMNDEVAPPAGLRERIVATAVAEPKHPEPASRATLDSKAPWWRRPVLWPLPVAAVITVLAVAVAVVSVWGSQTDGDLATSERRLDLAYDGIEIMAMADQWWRFSGSGTASGAAGSLAYSAEAGAACLLVWGLPEGDQTVYQVRLTQGDGQVSVRRMWRYNNAMWLILDGDPNRLEKLEITLSIGDLPPASDSPTLFDIPLTSS
ncbi:MAG: zf-HC2 domain-containing protein [Chloroflexi bacterium]|nr:zf-HC2 domain-containing protein [Chloroflexota bacterium]MCI0864164.1 zf-HC2 domain-containing protein [Chloroflexota bacterium]